MPANVKKTSNMRKHLTNEEKEKRSAAEATLERRFVRLVAPPRIVGNEDAYAYWKTTVSRMKGLTLLDNVDTDLLSSYCLAKASEDALREEYNSIRIKTDRTLERTLQKFLDGEYADNEYPARVLRAAMGNELALLKSLQAQERLVIGYQKELGLTPNARQRLAKKKAEERPVTEEDEDYG